MTKNTASGYGYSDRRPQLVRNRPANASTKSTMSVDENEFAPDSVTNYRNEQNFVGRETELAQLRGALAEAIAGRGGIVMLAGEPGIGKTRTAQELASYAESQGVRVLWGWCYEGEGAPPYWPWLEPIRDYVRRADSSVLRVQMGDGAAAIAEVAPDLSQYLGQTEPLPELEPSEARFRFFGAIASFLKNASADRPILLVLDDLHWADEPSLLLLQFISRQIEDSNLVIVGAYRDVEVERDYPITQTLGRLSQRSGFTRIPLGGLEAPEIGRFIEEDGSGEDGSGGINPDLVDAIKDYTNGNPFFVGEVLSLLKEQDRTVVALPSLEAAGLGLPLGVRDVIGQRLDRLSEPCNQALTTAAVVGRAFDFETLRRLMEPSTEEDLIERLEEALEAHLIQDVPGLAERYQFRHALVQQTFIEKLSSTRKIRLHARIGATLESIYGERVGDHVAELAHHFFQAAPVVGTSKLVKYSLLAGAQASAAYAYEEAMAHFRRGITTKGEDPDAPTKVQDEDVAELLFGLVRARSAARWP